MAALLLLSGVMAMGQDQSPPAPIAQAYLYLEPFEARVEVLLDLPTMLERLGIPHDAKAAVTAEEQEQIRKAASNLAKDWCHLKAEGESAKGALAAVAFVKGEPGKTLPMTADDLVKPGELMIGLVWEFGVGGDPKHVEVSWDGFAEPLSKLPLTVFVGNSAENLELTKQLPLVRWSDDAGHLPKPKPLAVVPTLPAQAVYAIPVAMIIWLLLGVAICVWMVVKRHKFPGGFVPFLAAWGVGVVMSYHMGVLRIPSPFSEKAAAVTKPEQAEKVLLPLLKNVYRAFDYRLETQVYDRLARSVDGELLRTLYLQTIQALTIEGQEGTRAKVNDLSVTVDKVTPQADGFVAEGEWTALGTVGHWGHQHQRVNRYKARLTVVPVGQEWKIRGMEVLEERRL